MGVRSMVIIRCCLRQSGGKVINGRVTRIFVFVVSPWFT